MRATHPEAAGVEGIAKHGKGDEAGDAAIAIEKKMDPEQPMMAVLSIENTHEGTE
jgi:hypothetical protein